MVWTTPPRPWLGSAHDSRLTPFHSILCHCSFPSPLPPPSPSYAPPCAPQSILDACLRDRKQAWELQPDGRFRLLGLTASHPLGAHPDPASGLSGGANGTAGSPYAGAGESYTLLPSETEGLHQALMNQTMRRVRGVQRDAAAGTVSDACILMEA